MPRVNVEIRRLGDGLWGRVAALPVSPQLAQTLEAAAKILHLGDQVRIAKCPTSRLDITV